MINIDYSNENIKNFILNNYETENILISNVDTIGKSTKMCQILQTIGFKSKAPLNAFKFTHFVILKNKKIGYWSLIDKNKNSIFYINQNQDTSYLQLQEN